MIMRQLIFVFSAALAIGLAAPARADVATGERAYLAADYRTALNELMPLAQQGDAQAQYLVGVMYAHGKAIERNFAEAESWYARAATQGHELAAFNLGFMYYNGAGEGENAVAQNYAKAVPWLGVAAAGGDGMAQALLGTLYYQGLGEPYAGMLREALKPALGVSALSAYLGAKVWMALVLGVVAVLSILVVALVCGWLVWRYRVIHASIRTSWQNDPALLRQIELLEEIARNTRHET